MGGRGCLAVATALASMLAGAARAETQAEPILGVGVEGGYDSNVLFDGRSDELTRVSPQVGLKLRDHLWSATGAYTADYLRYQRLQPGGVWNHRGTLSLAATPSERFNLNASLRGTYATDPVGLAQAGIFRSGQDRALFLQGGGRAEYGLERLLLVAGELVERVVRFQDGSGGAMHAPSVELLRALNQRLELGGAYAFSVFQDLQPGGSRLAFSHGLRARVRYRITRFLEVNAFGGPALWSGPSGRSVVPEVGGELLLAERDWDLRASVAHRLGLGSTAAPGLVNSVEIGTVRRFGRRFDLRGDGGIWQAGDIPTGRNATVGFALSAEGGWFVTKQLRLALAGSYLARLDDSSPLLRRTTVGIRMGWELPVR